MSKLETIIPREKASNISAVFQTNKGTFTATLFHQRAPKTVQNFIDLAEGTADWKDPKTGKVEKGKPYFDGLIFHRVIAGFMIQGGCPRGDGRGGPGYRFADEFHPELRHDGAGMLSMANSGPNTNGSQFFVTLGPTPHLDDRHAIFGEVTDGMEIIEAIGRVATEAGDRPRQDVVMEKVTIERS